MTAEELNISGLLELYVAGVLSEKENVEITELIAGNAELQAEVVEIENAIRKLTSSVAPHEAKSFNQIQNQLIDSEPEEEHRIQPTEKTGTPWISYLGWAASFLLGAAFLYQLTQTNVLKEQNAQLESQNDLLVQQVSSKTADLQQVNDFIEFTNQDGIIQVPLDGQANFNNTYARVFWDQTRDQVYIDASGLPEPPEGKEYQVWSLALNPLSPTSIGMLNNFTDGNKIFVLDNANPSQAFGITLEPTGGSESPTMEQLYTLGVV